MRCGLITAPADLHPDALLHMRAQQDVTVLLEQHAFSLARSAAATDRFPPAAAALATAAGLLPLVSRAACPPDGCLERRASGLASPASSTPLRACC